MVPPRGRGSDSRRRTHGRDALSGGGRIRHGCDSGDGFRSRHDDDSSGSRISDGGSKAMVRATGRGRRRLLHYGKEVVSSTRLHHGWVGEGEEMERMGE